MRTTFNKTLFSTCLQAAKVGQNIYFLGGIYDPYGPGLGKSKKMRLRILGNVYDGCESTRWNSLVQTSSFRFKLEFGSLDSRS